MELRFTPTRLARAAFAGTAVFTLLHLVVQTVRFASGDHSLGGAVTMFSLGSDRNLPTLFATLLILCCALLLAATAHAARRRGEPHAAWQFLAAVFLFLACDEILEIHERLIAPVRELTGGEGVLYYGWVIPYGVATLAVVALLSRFLLRLPPGTRRMFVASGAVYVAGALGLEMLGGAHASHAGTLNATYVAYQTVEEVLELLGMSAFLFALTRHAAGSYGEFTVTLAALPAAVCGSEARARRPADHGVDTQPAAARSPGTA